MPAPERLDQRDLARQVIGGIRRDAVQFGEQLRRDPLRLGMRHAVHHAVPGGFDRREDWLRLKPVEQNSQRRAVVGRGKAAGPFGCSTGRLTTRLVPLNPMRSIFPSSRRRSVSPASYTANRMLDEPPLIVSVPESPEVDEVPACSHCRRRLEERRLVPRPSEPVGECRASDAHAVDCDSHVGCPFS